MAGLEGTKLGAYELLERIGGGGMAEVYRAKQTTAFGREVAIKVIRPGYSEDQNFRERFLREAQAISRLSHPNILPLIEFGEEGETLFLVMPLAREGTLRDVLKQRNGPLPLEEVIPIFTQLCDAVQYAHEQGIVHRDLKPQNVLMQRKTHVFLADFGIARDSTETHMTATGAGIGTVEYMAPEQAMGQADARSDIYSLGIVLYQLLTGTVPFSGTTPFQIIMKQTNEPLPDPRAFNPALPHELLQVLKTALAKDPSRRFQSAQALGRAVQQVRPDIGPTALSPQGQVGGARPPAAGFPGPQAGNPPPITRSRPVDQTRGAGGERGSGPPARTGSTRPPAHTGGDWGENPRDYDAVPGPPPPGRGGWGDGPYEGEYDQPTWNTRSGPRSTRGGRGTMYGRPVGYADTPYQAPPRRGNGPLIAAIIAALLAVLVISTAAYGYFAGGWFGTAGSASPTTVVQGPTATTQPTDTATATLTPTETATATPTDTATPTATPIPAFKVTGISATVSPGNWNYTCSDPTASQLFTFNATINVNAGPTGRTVTYHWTRSDGASSPPVTVPVSTSSTSIAVTPDTWMLFSGVPNGTYWEAVVVTAPNSVTSNKATFTINCT